MCTQAAPGVPTISKPTAHSRGHGGPETDCDMPWAPQLARVTPTCPARSRTHPPTAAWPRWGWGDVGTVFAHGLPTCVTLKFRYLSGVTQPTSHVFRRHVPPLAKQLMLHNQPISAETLTPNTLHCATPARAGSKPNKKGSSLLLAPRLHTCSRSYLPSVLGNLHCSRLFQINVSWNFSRWIRPV